MRMQIKRQCCSACSVIFSDIRTFCKFQDRFSLVEICNSIKFQLITLCISDIIAHQRRQKEHFSLESIIRG